MAKIVSDTKTDKQAGHAGAGTDEEFCPPGLTSKHQAKTRRMLATWRRKLGVGLLALLLISSLLLAIPTTRYAVLGSFMQREFVVQIKDTDTKQPVMAATVELAGQKAETDAKGMAKIRAKVGDAKLTVTKKYYAKSVSEVLVPIAKKPGWEVVTLKATGRQVPVMVTNKITGKPLAGALLIAAGTTGRTDKDGKVTMVLPADLKSVDSKISLDGYNAVNGPLLVSEQAVPQNTFQLVPQGSIYFLSKLSGRIDVVKTNLDGSGRKTVLAGTGKERNTDTILLASRDWKYLALKSTRDGGEFAKLFLIDTKDDSLKTIDEGKASFDAVGWSGHRFVYKIGREGAKNWEPKGQALKSFDADSGKLTVIDETDGEGTGPGDYAFSLFGQVYILDDELVYNKNWIAGGYAARLPGKQVSLVSVKADGSARKTIKDFPVPADTLYHYSIDLRLYEAQEVYVQATGAQGVKASYFEYEDGVLSAKPDVTDQQFNEEYPTYLISPSGNKTFFGEARDGKNTLFVGDAAGSDKRQIVVLSEYTAYGWYTDDYVLVSKGGSELFIMPAADVAPLKITDYHKPDVNLRGYGYGYGGL